MPTKIRLSRHGRMRQPFYYIVVADSRAPRDGRFIERIGSYNPTTNPATIDLDFDKALDWVQKGAQPTDTCRAILSYKGVMYKKHLLEGVKKGAFPETVAEERFNNWMNEKEAKIQAKRDSVTKAADDAVKGRLEVEKKINEERAQELAKRKMAEKEAEVVTGAKASEGAEESPAETGEAPAENTAEGEGPKAE